jgi:glucose-6-phosphate dehydrogenase assembly protein OpcA
MDEVWSEQDTSPGQIEAALREMIGRRGENDERTFVPARVMNLVAIVDAEFRGEIENRLQRVGRFHPSRLILCSVRDGHDGRIDAWAGVGTEDAEAQPGHIAVAHERVELTVGPAQVEKLDTIVDPLLVPDLATMVWAPHGHDDAVDALRRLTQIVLIDSQDAPDASDALARAADLSDDLYVVDLSWLRSTPWRERVAGVFDPPDMRAQLSGISAVTVRHREDSLASALLFMGWLSSRLGWKPARLSAARGAMTGHARGRRSEVRMRCEPADMNPPGLDGVTIEMASGASVSLDRGEGGLRTVRHGRDGSEQEWTIVGASRGEAGILGEGVRQALLRDPTYRPALRCAQVMA